MSLHHLSLRCVSSQSPHGKLSLSSDLQQCYCLLCGWEDNRGEVETYDYPPLLCIISQELNYSEMEAFCILHVGAAAHRDF